MEDEKLRLILELTGSASISEAITKLGDLRAAAKQAADQQADGYQIVKSREEAAAVVQQEATDEWVREANEKVAAQRAVMRALEESQVQEEEALAMTRQRIRATGMSIRDLATGNIAGLGNALERAVGAGGALSMWIVGLGTVVAIAAPLIKDFAKHIFDAADHSGTLKERIEKVTAAINDYVEAQEHSNAEVKAYNEAIIEKARLDEEEAQRKRQASALKDEAIPGAAAGERGKLLTEAIGGKYLELTQRLVRTMHQQIDPQEKAMRDEIEALKTSMLGEIGEEGILTPRGKKMEERRAELERRVQPAGAIEATAQDIVGKAKAGDATAIAQLAKMFPGMGIEGATESAQIGAQMTKMAGKAAERDKQEAEKKDREAHQRAMTAATYEENRKADLRRRQKAQDEVRETALAEVAAWPAEKARLEEEEKREEEAANRKLETARKQAAAAAKHRDEEQAMAESLQLVSEAWREQTGGQMPNPRLAHHLADQALQRYKAGAEGWRAANNVVMAELQRINAEMARLGTAGRFGPQTQARSNQTWGTSP